MTNGGGRLTEIRTLRSRFEVPDIGCAHCKAAIEAAVSPLPGVASVDVDVDRRAVTVDHDPALAGGRAVVDAIEAIGYEISGRREEAPQ